MNQIKIEVWPIAKLVPYARAMRRNDDAVDRMVATIQEFGFRLPLLIRGDGEIVDGHLRLKAARKLGFAELPVIVCDDWTAAQVKAFRLAVNRSATWAVDQVLHAEGMPINTSPEKHQILWSVDGFEKTQAEDLVRTMAKCGKFFSNESMAAGYIGCIVCVHGFVSYSSEC